MKTYLYILSLIALGSCRSESIENQSSILSKCGLGDDKYDGELFIDSIGGFSLSIPKEWSNEITIQGNYRTITFQDTLSEHDSFETFNITEDKLYEGLNYDRSYEKVVKRIESDENLIILNQGSSTLDMQHANWIFYEDYTFLKENMTQRCLTISTKSDHKYYWILTCVIGDSKIENRMCELVSILNTFKMNKKIR